MKNLQLVKLQKSNESTVLKLNFTNVKLHLFTRTLNRTFIS
jgi:hypothetical protein